MDTNKKVWVDPPGGWKFGFPKVWDGEGSIIDWLRDNGYPQSWLDGFGESDIPVRFWSVEEEASN